MYKSYRENVDKALNKSYLKSLEKIGLILQTVGTRVLTKYRHVDTGRLRASLTYVTGDKVGKLKADKKGVVHNEDKPKGRLDEKTLQFGTNVEYAPNIERIHSFIKQPVIQNRSKLNDILADTVKEALDE